MEKIAAAILMCTSPDSKSAPPPAVLQMMFEQSCKITRLQTVGKGYRQLQLVVECKCEP